MYKKRILGLAIASAITLTGCLDDNKIVDQSNAGAQQGLNKQPAVPNVPTPPDGSVWPIFNPGTSALPIPNDLIFQKDNATTTAIESDGTFDVADSSPPVTTALNELSGASTIAPIDIAMSGEIDPATVLANASVWLIALDYASGSPLQGLSIQEPPTIILGDQPTFDVSVESFDDSTNNFIRITPTSPLMPNTRYVVGLTTSITNAAGDPIVRSPGLTGYDYLTDPTNPPASAALTAVQSLIGFWETMVGARTGGAVTPDNIALSYAFTTSNDEKVIDYIADPAQWFNDQLNVAIGVATAGSVVSASLDVGTKDGSGNIIPGADGTTDHSDVTIAIASTIAAFPNIPFTADDDVDNTNTFDDKLTAAGLSTAAVQSVLGCGSVTAGSAYISCLSALLGSSSGPFSTAGALGAFGLPAPAARTVDFSGGAATDINQVSSLTAGLGIPTGAAGVSVIQGTLDLPYYLGTPDGANGSALVTGNWVANDILAGTIGTALGLSIPQADASVTTAVNAIFPFPKIQETQTVPVLAIYPTTNSGNMKTVIFQHGITADRSAALAFGGSMVARAKAFGDDVAVIAIDQPLHGIGGISSAEKAALTEKLLVVASSLPDDRAADGDAFDGVSAAGQSTIDATVAGNAYIGVLQAIQAAPCPALAGLDLTGTVPADIGTALNQVSLGNCGGAAQTQLATIQLLEHTVANSGAAIPGLTAAKDGLGDDVEERHFGFASNSSGSLVALDPAGSKADNGSGSLFLNLTGFINTRDNLRQGTTDLLNLRQTIDDMDLDSDLTADELDSSNVYFIGHSLGNVNGVPFLSALNNTPNPADDIIAANLLMPTGGVARTLENSPSFGPRVVIGLKQAANLSQDNSSFQAYLNIFQAAIDSSDPVNFADSLTTPTLITELVGDGTVPNIVDATAVATAAAYVNGAAAQIEAATGVPLNLSGQGSLSPLSGTEPVATITGAATLNTAGNDQALSQNIVRFNTGEHTTPVFPTSDTFADVPGLQAAFGEMVVQATSIVLDDGNTVDIVNDAILD